ncbi:uncharacterized protein LOC134349633 [Mobula hypostoma]|uniref:uncharacterized protein LOC134349633 n=1 Tax=Mobula hypostoma TaxID=723540 RepID=UPI002FC2E3DA
MPLCFKSSSKEAWLLAINTDHLAGKRTVSVEAAPSLTCWWRVLFGFLALEIVTFGHVSLAGQQYGHIVYSRNQLIALMPAGLANRAADTPAEIWRKTHRGCRGGSQRQGRRTGSRQQRLMEKRSLVGNKMDELTALAVSQRTFRERSVMCFTETWLHEDIPDQNFYMEGFQTVRADRKCTDSSKRKGVGGLLFWLTTDDAILVILRSRNVFVARILNFLLLDSSHIPPKYNTGHSCLWTSNFAGP